MIKEFEISDILNAVNNISKIKRKKDYDNNKSNLTNKEHKISESEILVLDEMIE
jgi:hypothetical protein|tara:strand:- start:41 stop:202 length:162 start_codon:yes stop_codon:yes gene_type:complete